MALDDIQKQVDDWTSQFKKPYFEPLEQLSCLAEEVGEVAREMNHLYGGKKKKESDGIGTLGDELAEVLFVLCCIANREGLSLQQYWDKMMQERHYNRDNNRFEKAS